MAIKRTKSRFKGQDNKEKDKRNFDFISKQHNKSKKKLDSKKKEQRANQQAILSSHKILNWLHHLDSLNQSMILTSTINHQTINHQAHRIKNALIALFSPENMDLKVEANGNLKTKIPRFLSYFTKPNGKGGTNELKHRIFNESVLKIKRQNS